MTNVSDYQVNYWAGGETYEYKSPKPKRSIKRKLAIVFSFVFILAITPPIIHALSNLNFNQTKKVTVIETPTQITDPETHRVTIEESKTPEGQAEIINNDSYWKISKRVCGTGKYFLSIQTQNNSKALYQGETVTVSCVL